MNIELLALAVYIGMAIVAPRVLLALPLGVWAVYRYRPHLLYGLIPKALPYLPNFTSPRSDQPQDVKITRHAQCLHCDFTYQNRNYSLVIPYDDTYTVAHSNIRVMAHYTHGSLDITQPPGILLCPQSQHSWSSEYSC